MTLHTEKTTNILGVTMNVLSRKEVRERLRSMLHAGRGHHVVTPNPEFLLRAKSDAIFRSILNNAALAVPDGVGLVLAARFLGRPIGERFPGTDMVADIARIAAEEQKSLYLLGGFDDTPIRTAARLTRDNPSLKVVDAHGLERPGGQRYPDTALIERINRRKPDILLVAHGAPLQEYWLANHMDKLSSVAIGMGVGGAFDYLAGTVRRAPSPMRAAGLEWLFRLGRQPKRLPRIVNATVRFPYAVIRERMQR